MGDVGREDTRLVDQLFLPAVANVAYERDTSHCFWSTTGKLTPYCATKVILYHIPAQDSHAGGKRCCGAS